MSTEFVMRPIGIIRTPFTEPKGMPIQPAFSRAIGQVEVLPEYAEGLQDLEAFSHVILIYVPHRSEGYTLHVKPFLDDVRAVYLTHQRLGTWQSTGWQERIQHVLTDEQTRLAYD